MHTIYYLSMHPYYGESIASHSNNWLHLLSPADFLLLCEQLCWLTSPYWVSVLNEINKYSLSVVLKYLWLITEVWFAKDWNLRRETSFLSIKRSLTSQLNTTCNTGMLIRDIKGRKSCCLLIHSSWPPLCRIEKVLREWDMISISILTS